MIFKSIYFSVNDKMTTEDYQKKSVFGKKKIWKQHVINCMRLKRFHGLIFTRNAKRQIFKNQWCLRTWAVKELYDKKLHKEVAKYT